MKLANNIMNSDSYKTSHFTFQPEGTTRSYSYIEAREGGKYPETVFFGLQYYLNEYLTQPITQEMIDEAEVFLTAHGEPFNKAGWQHILDNHGGKLPLRIKALPEGTVAPLGTVLVTVENTDEECAWLTSYIETAMLRAVWYPTTVATHSRAVKNVILKYLENTGDPSLIPFKLVDFGARGVSSTESAQIGGAAHLLNFMSTDNLMAIKFTQDHYGSAELTGFSIPATEHSVTCMMGRDGEPEFFKNILKVHGKPGAMISVVCDTYDIDMAIKYWGDLRSEIEALGCTIVIRPDSGVPKDMVLHVTEELDKYFGHSVNDKGFKVLNPCVRVIQGDGITLESVEEILEKLTGAGWSADNVTFGSGGWLLQQVNRDTLRFAMKGSWCVVNGEERNIFKDPKTDHTKASKTGRFSVVRCRSGKLETVPEFKVEHGANSNWAPGVDLLETVFLNGATVRHQSFDAVKAKLDGND